MVIVDLERLRGFPPDRLAMCFFREVFLFFFSGLFHTVFPSSELGFIGTLAGFRGFDSTVFWDFCEIWLCLYYYTVLKTRYTHWAASNAKSIDVIV